MSIPSARLSGKSRRLPTANNHTAHNACVPHPNSNTRSHVYARRTYTWRHTGQPTHAAHPDSIDVHCQPVEHSRTPHTGVCVHCQRLQQRLSQGVARAASLACIAACTATSGSTRTRTSGAVPSELGRAPSPTTLTRSAPSATARQQLMAQSFATGLCAGRSPLNFPNERGEERLPRPPSPL